jgi:hypothetical protein
MTMRIALALPLLALAACNVENDPDNDSISLGYNQQRLEDAASDVGNAASDAASAVGNVAGETGRAISNEVGDIDVDITRNRGGEGNAGGNRQ